MIPQLRGWHQRYAGAGLTIVAVHSPEFLWERSYDRVAAAVRELGIRYPVVQDNDFAIWTRFNTWAWPTAVLVDRQAFRAGTEVRLTRKEFHLLRYLVEHRGEILTRERLLDDVWGYERFPTTRTVDTHVLRLRQKFERDPERPEHILTVHGQGYRFAG